MAEGEKSPDEIMQDLEQLASAAGGVTEATIGATIDASKSGQGLGFLADVSLHVTVEVGRTKMTIQDLLQLGQGSVIELTKLAGEPLDIFINHKQVARGEAVIVNEKFGVRLTDIISPEDRIGSVSK